MYVRKALAVSTVAFTLVGGVAFTQYHHDQGKQD